MKISKGSKAIMDGGISCFTWSKLRLIRQRNTLNTICKQCTKDGNDICIAGEDNHCEVRQYLNKITNLLEGTE